MAYASGCVRRNVCNDHVGLMTRLAEALAAHPAVPPSAPPALTPRLQGNITEFSAWVLGAEHWRLYDRRWSWAPNAESPWRDTSSDGVDILALSKANEPPLLVVEVKSSDGPGASLVTGGSASLQSDFTRLFEGTVQSRLHVSVSRVLCDLRYKRGQPELEERVKSYVDGATPSECPDVHLVGILFCNGDGAGGVATRERAFSRLKQALVALGWSESQLGFVTVEVDCLQELLKQVIAVVARS